MVPRAPAGSAASVHGADEGHAQATELARWDQAYRGAPAAADVAPSSALSELLAAAVAAAVVAPEREARRWFSWPWYWADTLVDDLVRSGRLRRVDGHLAAVSGTAR